MFGVCDGYYGHDQRRVGMETDRFEGAIGTMTGLPQVAKRLGIR